MKRKLGNSRPRAMQKTFPVRGPLNCKAKGDLAEIAFLYKAANLGFGVAKPYGDKELYDFILDSGERFWRVEVKSTSYAKTGRSGYSVNACRMRTRLNLKSYQADEIDFLAAYIVPVDTWYIIPACQLTSVYVLRLYPSDQGKGCFEAFREAWYLMAQGADLRQTQNPAPDSRHRPSRQTFPGISRA